MTLKIREQLLRAIPPYYLKIPRFWHTVFLNWRWNLKLKVTKTTISQNDSLFLPNNTTLKNIMDESCTIPSEKFDSGDTISAQINKREDFPVIKKNIEVNDVQTLCLHVNEIYVTVNKMGEDVTDLKRKIFELTNRVNDNDKTLL